MKCELLIPDHPWSIELTREDADRFWTVMNTTHALQTENDVVWLTIINRKRYWFATEPNVLLWGVVESSDPIDQLIVPFTPTALNSLFNFLMAHERCELTIEKDEIPRKHVAVWRSMNGDFFCADVPTVYDQVADFEPHGNTSCELTSEQTQMLGDFMRSWPPGISPEGHPTPFLPAFAHLTVDAEGLQCSMDWTRYRGSMNTIGLKTTTSGAGSIQFEPCVISRALGRFGEENPITVTFHSEARTAVYFHNDEWGFKVLASRECVARWGFLVSSYLEQEGVDVGKWDDEPVVPVLPFAYRDVPMEVSLVSDAGGVDDFLRITMNVASNVVFNLELMKELNTYNNMAVGVSAVFNSDGVYLTVDVPCTAYRTGLMPSIRRLFERQHDLVAVVAMFGDGATLFDEQGNPTY